MWKCTFLQIISIILVSFNVLVVNYLLKKFHKIYLSILDQTVISPFTFSITADHEEYFVSHSLWQMKNEILQVKREIKHLYNNVIL